MGRENSGRRRQPTALKMLRGNPSKTKLNVNEPTPDGPVAKPIYLSVLADVAWEQIAPVAIAMGTLTAADVWAFSALCELQGTLWHAAVKKEMAADLPAALKLERETAIALRPYYALFGLDPSSRARLSVPKGAREPESKWAGILA